jgi:UPF0271 protein
MSAWLNIDAGETALETEELWSLAQGLSIACGGHAGDDESMDRVLRSCAATGARPGAHPSYEDRENFGREAQSISPGELRDAVARQCARLGGRAEKQGVRVLYVKPHGALYHAADGDPALAEAVVRAARAALGPAVRVVGPAGGALATAAAGAGLVFLREGFADRGLQPLGDGRYRLVPRGEPGALLDDPALAAAQARRLAGEGACDTICVHGDGARALDVARAVREALDTCA